MYHRNAAQVIAFVVLAGALLLAPLAQAQGPTPPPPQRGLHYEIDQQGLLPRLPGARPEAQAADQANAPACAPWSKLTFASYRSQNDWEVYTANGDGTSPARVTNHEGADTAPKFNRGCTRIVYQSAQGPQYEVYAINPNGTNPVSLSNHGAFDGLPCWSPDGARIAFQTNRNGNNEVYVMNADGSGQTNLTNHPAYDGMPAWSPDGTRIAFVSNRSGQYEIWAMNTDGTGQTQVTHGVAWAEYPCWSPEGSKLAFSNDDNGDGFMDVDVVNADGTGFTFLAGHTTNVDYWYPAWSPDGEWIAYSRTELIYYQGQWYWTRSDVYAQGAPGYSYGQTALVASGYDWRPHWGTLDAQPPTSSVNRLPPYTGFLDTISWSGQDVGPAGIWSYDVQYRDGESGVWTDWLLNTPYTSGSFSGVAGHTYYFRCRARDRAGNLEPYPSTGPYPHTIFYTYRLRGAVRDNRDTPVTHATVSITPPPLNPAAVDSNGDYGVYLTGPDLHTVGVSKTSYGNLPLMSIQADQQSVFTCLPPTDDRVQNGGFEASPFVPSGWLRQGTIPVIITSTSKHTGNYAARLGLPLPSSFAPALNLSNNGKARLSNLVLDSAGIVHVAWTTWDWTYYGEIYYAQRGSDGTWSSPQNLSKNTSDSGTPLLAVDKNGDVHAVWCDNASGKYEIYYAWRASNGTWSSPQKISQSAYGSRPARLTVDGNGMLHLAWYDRGDYWTTEGGDVYYACRPSNGVWSNALNISNNTCTSASPHLAVEENGTAHVVWPDKPSGNYEIYYARRESNGSWSITRNISSTPGDSLYPRVAVDRGRNVHVVWSDKFAGQSHIYYARCSPGGVWSSPQSLFSSPRDLWLPQLVVDKSGVVHVMWDDGDEIYYARRSGNGTWDSAQNLSNNPGLSRDPKLAVDEGGVVHAVWWDYTVESSKIYYIRRGSGGSWSSPLDLSHNVPYSSQYPDLAVDNSVHVAWYNWDHLDTNDVYYVGPANAEQSGDSMIAQAITVPITMSMPTLSFLYQLGGGASATNGTWFHAQVDDGVTFTTILSTSTNTAGWAHGWADLTPWAGQTITLTFNVHNEAGTPVTWAYLDEVTLGSAYPNLWVQKTGDNTVPPGGGPVRYTITYGNLGGVPATGVCLTDTLPAGVTFVSASVPPTSTAPLVWDVGNLAAGAGPFTIIVTGTVEAGTPAWTTFANTVTIGAVTPEADKDNNTAVAQTFVGYRLYLPLTMKDW